MKKLTTSILLALFSATIFTPTHVEASWLSKTWKKVEKSWNEAGKRSGSTGMSGTSTSAIRLPQRSEYPSSYPSAQKIGYLLGGQERSIAGIYPNATYEEIRQILGNPTEEVHHEYRRDGEQRAFMRYGGITYGSIYGQIERAGVIEVINRDATTYRGIAVGDSLEKVYEAYGKPVRIYDDNTWFYGEFIWKSDYVYGIQFINDGEKVTKIRIL
ncbi:hypothetical protein [Veillonella sp. oral taxon 780]|uniref:hypothetical protein n=1 Tax=Veillonella sp. oral taxon 780 TaxID=671229 RepID=UPI00021A3809|nr:hypothetical protein [Veillonella sp. oral taxon 780]EGS34599.1 hypothetical protein HMPREF9200_1265 [Veillonella sp. oral taxon 780 str. F0422]